MPRISLRVLSVPLLTMVFAAGALAQTSGSIRGQVTDQDGAALPGVNVTVTSTDRGTTRSVLTGATGAFGFPSLDVGTYDLLASLDGFQNHVVEGIRVGISTTISLDLTMEIGTVQDAITVAGAPLVDLTMSSVGTNYSADFIEELPTTRNFWDMMAVAPGVAPQSEQSTGLSIFGSGTSSNSWSIDGLDTTNADTGEAWWWINPDTIEEVQVLGIGAPAEYGNMSGGALNVVTKSGTNNLQGSVNVYYESDGLTGENASIDGRPFYRDKFQDTTFSLGGPLKKDKLWFFLSYQHYRDGVAEPGEDPDFPSDNRSDRYDMKVNAQLTDSTSVDAKWHYEDWDFAWADPNYTLSASGANFGTNPAWGVRLDSVLSSNSLFEVSYAGYRGLENNKSRTRSQEDPYFDKDPEGGGGWQFSGGYWYPYEWDIQRDQAKATLSKHADDFLGGDHQFKFGISYGEGLGDTITAGGPNGVYYYRGYEYYSYYYYQYLNYYYRGTARAYHYGAETATTSAFIDDSWKVNENLTLNLGVRFDSISSDIPDYPMLDRSWQPTGEVIPGVSNAVEWDHISPRIGFAWRTGHSGVLRGFYGKFYDGNVMGNWYAPPPNPPTYDYEYAVSLDGPWYYWYTWEWHGNPINKDLKPPETDQFTLGFERQFGNVYSLGIQGVYKEGKNLIGWEILDDGVYEMVPWVNPFTGETVMLASIVEEPSRRKGNGPGPGSLAPPGTRFHHEYTGAFITFNKRYQDGWSMKASYTWSDSDGFLPKPTSTVQGDAFYTGTDGRDPNNWINAEQALQAERKHVVQVQTRFDLPWGLTGSAVYRFLSGKPYSRQLSVGGMGGSSALNQGSATVIAVPASSDVTMPDQNILDVGLAKDFQIGSTELGINLKLFNALNDDGHDWWQTLRVRPGDEYVPSGYIYPRRLMVHLRLGF